MDLDFWAIVELGFLRLSRGTGRRVMRGDCDFVGMVEQVDFVRRRRRWCKDFKML